MASTLISGSDDRQSIFVVLNTAKDKKNVSVKRLEERTKGFTKMKNIHTGEITAVGDFSLEAKASAVFELLR